MLNSKTAEFVGRVWMVAAEVGCNAPKITDKLIEEEFPETTRHAEREGALIFFRNGVIGEVKRILKNGNGSLGQADLCSLFPDFAHVLKRLKSKTYYVESVQEYMPISHLIDEPALLNEARRFMRAKGKQCIKEARHLDDLYRMVTGGEAD